MGRQRRAAVDERAVPIDDITYGLRPTALDADGVRLLAAVTGSRATTRTPLISPRAGIRKLEGDDLVPAGLSRDGSTMLMQTDGLEPDRRHDVVTVPWDAGAPRVLVRDARSPTWTG